MVQVVRHFEDHAPQFQILLPFLIDRIIAEQCSENVARDGTGGVAVAAVIYGGNDAGGKIIRMPQRTVDGDGECFFRDPALTEPVDVFKIRRLIASQLFSFVSLCSLSSSSIIDNLLSADSMFYDRSWIFKCSAVNPPEVSFALRRMHTFSHIPD